MRELFWSECRRFRSWAFVFAAVHLVLQVKFNHPMSILSTAPNAFVLPYGLYSLAGVVLGLHQVGAYCQAGRWLWLMHRPLSRAAILLGIALSAAALIAACIGLPALLGLLRVAGTNETVVDQRHYMMVVHAVLITMIAWLCGACATLSRSRASVVVFAFPVLLIALAKSLSSFAMLIPSLACLGLLAFITYCTFKPNRHSHSNNGFALALAAVPLQIGFYFALLMVGGTVFVITKPNKTELIATYPNGLTAALRGSNEVLMKAGLRGEDQLLPVGADNVYVDVRKVKYPQRHGFANNAGSWIDGMDKNVIWTFSHDAMRFRGIDTVTGAHKGWYGVHGIHDQQPFTEVPIVKRDMLLTTRQVYVRDKMLQMPLSMFKLRDGEELISDLVTNRDLQFILTNQRLLGFPRSLTYVSTAQMPFLSPVVSVTLPATSQSLVSAGIQLYYDANDKQLAGSTPPAQTLVSFLYGPGKNDSGGGAQYIVRVDAGGATRLVAQRALTPEGSLFYRYGATLVSPLISGVLESAEQWLANETATARPADRVIPPMPVMLVALGWAVLAALGAWLWLRRAAVSARHKAGWIIGCLAVGPAALLSLMVLQERTATAPKVSAKRFDVVVQAAV